MEFVFFFALSERERQHWLKRKYVQRRLLLVLKCDDRANGFQRNNILEIAK